jgi:hypothetical protein
MPAPDFTLRFLTLSGTSAPGGVSAAYWLQSNSQSTADFGERIWADLGPRRERWVLVTILFDRQVDPNMPVFTTFVEAIRNSVDRSLKEREMP